MGAVGPLLRCVSLRTDVDTHTHTYVRAYCLTNLYELDVFGTKSDLGTSCFVCLC